MTTNQDLATRGEVQRTPVQTLVARLRDPVSRDQFAMVLPATVSVDKFERIATTAILTNPDIASLDHTSVLRAMIQAAADGLMPDGKEGAIVGRGGKAVWQPMIKGRRKAVAEYGWTVKTKAVYAADVFEWTDEPPARLHQQARPGVDRGALIGAYAVATHVDGREMQMFMPWEDIAKRREIATTKAVWDKWPAEMAEKTVGHAVIADLPLADADRERLARIFETTALEPGEAAVKLYGGPAAVTPLELEAPQTAAAVDASPTVAGGDRQPADGAAQEPPASDVASSAPDDDEPELEDVNGQSSDEQTAIQAAGDQAAMFHPPNGKHTQLSLAEILAFGDTGRHWLRVMLRKGDQLKPDAYRTAVWNFARVYAPDLFQQVLAELEVAA